jgi:hypothetical protein
MSLPSLPKIPKYTVPEIPGAAEAAQKIADAKASLLSRRNPIPQVHNPTPGATVQKTIEQIKQEAVAEAKYEYGLVSQGGVVTDDTDIFDHPTYAKIVDVYDDSCTKIVTMFFDVLHGVLEALVKVYRLLNDLQKEVDLELDKYPDWPHFPSFPDGPSIDIDTIDTDELKCPLAECLGLPSPPTFKFPVGMSMEEALAPRMVPDPEDPEGPYIEEPSPYTEQDWKQWRGAFDEYTDRVGQTAGLAARTTLSNTIKIIKATPQGLVNGIVDAAKATIAGMVSSVVFDKIEAQLDCMSAKDPRINEVYEVLLFRKMKQQMAFDSANNPIIKLQGRAQGLLDEVQDKLSVLEGKRNEAQGLLSKGSGALELPDPEPLNAVSNLKNKFF